jgi:hypothetical protein
MKTGDGDNGLLFITLADLPPVPKAFPKVDCADVTLWTKHSYCDLVRIQDQQAGATDGNSSASRKQGHQRGKQSHLYLQNKDGSLVSVAKVSEMSVEIRSVWETLARRKIAPKTFGKISSEAWEFLACVILPKFKFLLYCDDSQWKLKEWCKQNYSSWTHNRGIRPPPAKKTETVDNILNNSKLLQMNTPASLDDNSFADNSESTGGRDNTGEDTDDEDNDEDEDAPCSPSRQQVCDIFFVICHCQHRHMCTGHRASGKYTCQFSHNGSLVSTPLI